MSRGKEPLPSRGFSCTSVSRHSRRRSRAPADHPPEWDLIAQPDPGFEFDQRLSW